MARNRFTGRMSVLFIPVFRALLAFLKTRTLLRMFFPGMIIPTRRALRQSGSGIPFLLLLVLRTVMRRCEVFRKRRLRILLVKIRRNVLIRPRLFLFVFLVPRRRIRLIPRSGLVQRLRVMRRRWTRIIIVLMNRKWWTVFRNRPLSLTLKRFVNRVFHFRVKLKSFWLILLVL